MRFETGVTIDASAERVWRTMTDVTRWPEFTPTMTSLRRLDEGPLGAGSRVRIKQPGIPALDWVVTELHPGTSFVWETSTGGVTISGGHALTPRDGGGVSLVLSITQTGLLAPLLTLLTGRRTRRYVRIEAESLKRRCEAPPTDE
ncbi:SRPBCC family protein [Nonomuraea sp. K274]|uniref:SRPBCC family protein n=1 Tax=Nonomuraea cypriaca TaxID=1187855 RepID=A0A931F6X5_9ACTN|nr:SRPBCC family protein [Nonomuraea cypriaca]MBF8193748.1 SRPBCC family protein [Nonomuraea cypriaca]